MDADWLKKGHMFTDEYFDRQLQQIREIRLSERKFYQKARKSIFGFSSRQADEEALRAERTLPYPSAFAPPNSLLSPRLWCQGFRSHTPGVPGTGSGKSGDDGSVLRLLARCPAQGLKW